MSLPINASLFVNYFQPTGNVGEYTFESAIFNNQTDTVGAGALAAKVGGLIYISATDLNTGAPIPGGFHRYKLTAISAATPAELSGTILWDERQSGEVDSPTNGSYCLYAEATPLQGYGLVPSDTVYTELAPGSSLAAMLLDIRDITDPFSVVGGNLLFDGTTTDATPLLLTPVSSPAFITANSSAVFKALVMGRNTAGGGCAFELTGMVIQGPSTPSVILNSISKVIVARSNSLWDSQIIADPVHGGISVQVTGSAGETLIWTSSVQFVKSTN